jgi:predicted RNase H-like nuclease (RuvC/YqgF family)
MAEEKDGYILDVIANLQKSLTSESKSNYYLRREIEKYEETITSLKFRLDMADNEIAEKTKEVGELSKLKEMNKELLENITILRQALQNKTEAYDFLAAKINGKLETK